MLSSPSRSPRPLLLHRKPSKHPDLPTASGPGPSRRQVRTGFTEPLTSAASTPKPKSGAALPRGPATPGPRHPNRAHSPCVLLRGPAPSTAEGQPRPPPSRQGCFGCCRRNHGLPSHAKTGGGHSAFGPEPEPAPGDGADHCEPAAGGAAGTGSRRPRALTLPAGGASAPSLRRAS